MKELTVNIIPIPKARPRVCKTGFTYTPKTTVACEKKIKTAWIEKYGKNPIGNRDPIYVGVKFYMPIAKSLKPDRRKFAILGILRPCKRPDTDNLVKLVADALNEIAYEDDCQIVKMVQEKFYGETPCIKIEIENLTDKSLPHPLMSGYK